MHTAAILDNPTWRMAIHHATHGVTRALHHGFLIRKTTEPFTIQDVKGVLGLAEQPRRPMGSYNYNVFKAVVLLNDGRYCYLEAWQAVEETETAWSGRGNAVYTRSLKSLLAELSSENVDLLKLQPKRILK